MNTSIIFFSVIIAAVVNVASASANFSLCGRALTGQKAAHPVVLLEEYLMKYQSNFEYVIPEKDLQTFREIIENYYDLLGSNPGKSYAYSYPELEAYLNGKSAFNIEEQWIKLPSGQMIKKSLDTSRVRIFRVSNSNTAPSAIKGILPYEQNERWNKVFLNYLGYGTLGIFSIALGIPVDGSSPDAVSGLVFLLSSLGSVSGLSYTALVTKPTETSNDRMRDHNLTIIENLNSFVERFHHSKNERSALYSLELIESLDALHPDPKDKSLEAFGGFDIFLHRPEKGDDSRVDTYLIPWIVDQKTKQRLKQSEEHLRVNRADHE